MHEGVERLSSNRELLLHIGHGKTGSTYIQAMLRRSRNALKDAGISYPTSDDEALISHDGTITSGNSQKLLSTRESFHGALASAAGESQRVLYSSEWMFADLFRASERQDSFLEEIAKEHGFETVKVLLFIRDPIDHVISQWQQSVKRQGSTQSLDEFAGTFDRPDKVAVLLDALDEMNDVEVSVRNYSQSRSELLTVFADWLSVETSNLVTPDVSNINRSLSAAELELQLSFNAHFGACGHLIADPLCEEIPDVQPSSQTPSQRTQNELLQRIAPSLERVNARLAPEHRYRSIAVEPSAPESIEFTTRQLDVVAAAIARHCATLDTPALPPMSDPRPPDEPARERRFPLPDRPSALARRLIRRATGPRDGLPG